MGSPVSAAQAAAALSAADRSMRRTDTPSNQPVAPHGGFQQQPLQGRPPQVQAPHGGPQQVQAAHDGPPHHQSPHAQPQQFQPTPYPSQQDASGTARQLSHHRSVFEPAAPAPMLPTRPTPNLAPLSPAGPTFPGQPVGPMVPPSTGLLPTLPAANPIAPPPMVSTIAAAPSEPTLHALKAAQLRNRRQPTHGKLFGRTMLVFMLIGALLAAALTVGRSLLFPTDWDPALTPIVDDIQQTLGIEFDPTIPVVVQSEDTYATDLLTATVGTGWSESVPAWRALGLAEGDVTPASVAAVLSERQPAFYDPSSGTIHQLQGLEPEQLRPSLQAALLAALRHQTQTAAIASADATENSADVDSSIEVRTASNEVAAFTGVTDPRTLAVRAVDAYLIDRAAVDVFGAMTPPVSTIGLPVPIAYQMAAVGRLGEAILESAGSDLERVAFGDDRLDTGRDWLDDQPIIGLRPRLEADDRVVEGPIALGVDDWTLVWGARLPAETVDRLARIVGGDSYQPFIRNGTACFAGVFQTGNETAASSLFTAMQQWAASSAAGSQAAAVQLDPTTVQIAACDPGATATSIPDPGTVDALIDRQIARLTR